jgi:hypothetical protein
MTADDEGWPELCLACHTNGGRATQRQMHARRTALWMLTQEFQPATVRQMFYQATVHGIVAKTEAGYDQIQRCLVDLRLNHNMPFSWLADFTRWQRKPRTHESLEQMLRITAETYRRALWVDADCHVEIWIEKDALSTPAQIAEWNLPTRPTKASDSRSVRWAGGDSVELDAIDPNRLRDLVRDCIEQHVDQHKLVILRAAEESERELLRAWRPGERAVPP